MGCAKTTLGVAHKTRIALTDRCAALVHAKDKHKVAHKVAHKDKLAKTTNAFLFNPATTNAKRGKKPALVEAIKCATKTLWVALNGLLPSPVQTDKSAKAVCA